MSPRIVCTCAAGLLLTLLACGTPEGRGGSDSATTPPTSARRTTTHDRRGFATYVEDGVLLVFEENGDAHREFIATGDLEIAGTVTGDAPNDLPMICDSAPTALEYLGAKPGFRVFFRDNRLWVFRDGAVGIVGFLEGGAPAEFATREGEGPLDSDLCSDDAEVLTAYLAL